MRFPGGESLAEAQNRMVQTLDGLRAQHPKATIAVVSHADLIKLAVAYYIGVHIDLFQRLVISPCSLTALSFSKMGPRLSAFNDTGSIEHLVPKPEEPAAEQPATAETPSAPDSQAQNGADPATAAVSRGQSDHG
jgi:probable phosphoglycerate mutase